MPFLIEGGIEKGPLLFFEFGFRLGNWEMHLEVNLGVFRGIK